MEHTYQILLEILKENFGVVIFDEHEDFAISDYIPDSISFIQFIVSLEEKLQRELPDDFLLFDTLTSAHGFAEKLDAFITSSQEENTISKHDSE